MVPVANLGFFLGVGGLCQLPEWVCLPVIFAENCMKMKEFGLPGGCASLAPPHLDLPIGTLTEDANIGIIANFVC